MSLVVDAPAESPIPAIVAVWVSITVWIIVRIAVVGVVYPVPLPIVTSIPGIAIYAPVHPIIVAINPPLPSLSGVIPLRGDRSDTDRNHRKCEDKHQRNRNCLLLKSFVIHIPPFPEPVARSSVNELQG
jgi:hypothetical protein